MELSLKIITILIEIGVVMVAVLLHVAYLTYFERKVLAHMQDRLGPMEVGTHGLLQPIADGLKLFFKEDIIPSGANKIIFSISPIIVLVPALIGFAVIPFGGKSLTLFGLTFHPYITDINIGILYIFAFASVGTYGVLLGGWSSNSKYSLLGGLRAAAQVISYELVLGMSVVGVLLLSKSLSLVKIVEAQTSVWFVIFQPVAFIIYVISAVAETNRLPFDMPEAESELVAGFFTEYSGMRFAFFFLAEYANMILVSSLATILFLGGWHPPFAFLSFIPSIFWFLIKVYSILFFFIWIRATLPRLRYDQLMRLGWKILLPIVFANIVITAVVLYFVR
ncbi:MAG: NADH-quinone oxidoreductase subunit NuoH [Nitrospirota bacterium]